MIGYQIIEADNIAMLQREVDAILRLISFGDNRQSADDEDIRHVAGEQYHKKIQSIETPQEETPLHHTVVAPREEEHPGTFTDMIFVIGGKTTSTMQLMYGALRAAEQQKYRTVAVRTLPDREQELILGIDIMKMFTRGSDMTVLLVRRKEYVNGTAKPDKLPRP